MPNNLFKPQNPYKNDPENNDKKPKFSLLYYVVIVLLLIGLQLAFFWSGSSEEIPYSEFRSYIEENKIESVKIAPERIYVNLKPGVIPSGAKSGDGSLSAEPTEVYVTPVVDDGLIVLLESKGISYQGIP